MRWLLLALALVGCASQKVPSRCERLCGTAPDPRACEGRCAPRVQAAMAAAFATAPAATALLPVRATYQDASIKVRRQEECLWLRGRTPSQVGKDALQQFKVGIGLPETIRFARTLPACSSHISFAIGQLNKVTAKLAMNYEARSIYGGGEWSIGNPQCDIYSHPYYATERLAGCAVSAKAACATSPLLTPGLADYLNLRVENGRCVEGATFTLIAPLEPYDQARARDGAVSRRATLPPLTTDQRTKLHATHAAHAAASDWRCGVGPAPAPGSVTQAHLALEATATSEAQHHHFRMKDFSGAVDAGWSQADVCTLARMQDHAHGGTPTPGRPSWMVAVEGRDWYHSRMAENDHMHAHICMGLKDARLKVQPFCAAGETGHVDACPVLTCAEWIAQERPFHQPPGSPPL